MSDFVEELLTTTDLAEMFGVTRETIRNWRNYGLPHYFISPRIIRYDKEEVMEWFNSTRRVKGRVFIGSPGRPKKDRSWMDRYRKEKINGSQDSESESRN